jgi:hypothetical protein
VKPWRILGMDAVIAKNHSQIRLQRFNDKREQL